MGQGGGEAGRALRALRRPTEAVRRSIGVGSTGFSRSLRSEFCLLKVGGRGKPGTTFLEMRRPKPGRGNIGGSLFSSKHGLGFSSRPSHLLKLNHRRSLCAIFSDSTDKGGEGSAAMIAVIKVKGNGRVGDLGSMMNERDQKRRSCKVPDIDAGNNGGSGIMYLTLAMGVG